MRSHLVISVVLAALVPSSGIAQQPASTPAAPATPPLQEILLHLQDNLWDYLTNLPDIFADERVVSELKQEGARGVKTTTDSVFRLVRSHNVGEAHTFTETREIKSVNKKAAKGEDIHGPALFSGAFSTAVNVVSLEMSRCFDYTLQPTGVLNKTPAIVIDYALKPDLTPDDGCPGPDKQSGRAFIDSATFHPLRVEMTIPNHKDNNGRRVLWTWSIDYAPIPFDAKQFWLPRTITSRADAHDASGTWFFTATYTNYHKLSVSSRIIPDVGGNPPPK
ncbi:hypothetical protein [Edaphobacter aggregans]|uniref:hypothetical protein n=1 Tax=Edaphobacter aggregans TaxID=570835 RepID=UPI00054E50D8|nr:hypothetical protein [Edaphobacter aggregans]